MVIICVFFIVSTVFFIHFFFFFFNDTATTEIYTLSLHDALPILPRITPSLASMRWIVGSERREALASSRWSIPARARAARSCREVIRDLPRSRHTVHEE